MIDGIGDNMLDVELVNSSGKESFSYPLFRYHP
jgi:hypothetical protein